MNSSSNTTPLLSTHSKPLCYSKNNDLISVAQQADKILLINQHELKPHCYISTANKDRTLSLRLKNNLLIRGGSEGVITLWDIRQFPTDSPIHSFNRPGCKFNAIDLSEHILAGGASKRMIFWDLRKMKQRCEFTQSFNEDITGIEFSKELPTVFHACTMDGLIAKFDLSEQTEQAAFAWGHQIIQSPCKLEISGNITLVQTQDQVLLTLQEQSLKQKFTVNSIQHPTHILNSFLGQQRHIHYYTKNMKNNSNQYWIGKYNIGYLPTKTNIELLIPLTQQKVIFSDVEGNWQYSKVVKGINHKSLDQNENFMTVEELEAREGKKSKQQICNSNGFIITKPSTLKTHSKKFKPY